MSRIEKALERATKIRDLTQVKDRDEFKPLAECPSRDNDYIPYNPYLVAFSAPDSPIAEEYKKLKSMIVRLTRKQGFQNVLMVTSSLSGEGKTVTAINLAITLAKDYNYSVLLIDADLRNPAVPGYLGLQPVAGLSDCIAGKANIADAIMKTGISKLSFIAAGSNTKDPAELLSSVSMQHLINEVKTRYPDRYIIIDTPPALLFAETHAICAAVDGVLFVVREGATTAENVKKALDILKDSTILGIVYNAVSEDILDGHKYHYKYRDQKRQEG